MPVDDEEIRSVAPIPPPEFVAGHDLPTISHQQLDYHPERDRIEAGHLADIYKAAVVGSDLTVAVKRVPKRRTTSREQQERMLRGAELGESVCDHPYVATIFDYDERPYPWIALEFVDGGPLHASRDEMSADQRLWTAYAIVDAVAHVNSGGVCHHDITPSNVLLSRTPRDFWPVPKLVDWGEAQEMQDGRRPERITEDYAAPEMRDGKLPGASLGYQSDVYQVGVVCYELLTGRLPDHPASSPSAITRPSELAAVPSELDDPIRKALQMDPDQRQHTISLREDFERALTERLQTASGGESASDRVGSAAETPGTDTSEATRVIGHERSASRSESVGLDGAWPAYRGSVRRTGQAKPGSGLVTSLSPSWHYETDREVQSSPAVADDTVFVGGKDGTVRAIDARDGDEVWSKHLGFRIRSSPALSQNAVYVGSQDSCLYALQRESGKLLWEFDAPRGWVDSSPLVYDDTVYVGCNDNTLYAVDASDGSLNWEYDTGGEVGASSPALAAETVYIAGDSGDLHAVDTRTGLRDWRFETQFLLPSTPAVADGTVYVGGSQNRLYAVDAADSSLRWSFDTGGEVRSSPAVAEGTVVFGADDGDIYAVDAADGEEQWRRSTEDWVRCSPTVAGGKVFVGSCTGSFYVLDLSNGKPVDGFDTGGWITSSPAVTETGVFVGCESGVYAFGVGN